MVTVWDRDNGEPDLVESTSEPNADKHTPVRIFGIRRCGVCIRICEMNISLQTSHIRHSTSIGYTPLSEWGFSVPEPLDRPLRAVSSMQQVCPILFPSRHFIVHFKMSLSVNCDSLPWCFEGVAGCIGEECSTGPFPWTDEAIRTGVCVSDCPWLEDMEQFCQGWTVGDRPCSEFYSCAVEPPVICTR